MRRLLALIAALWFANAAPAQITPIHFTGCPGSFYPHTSGLPRVGWGVEVYCPECLGRHADSWIVAGLSVHRTPAGDLGCLPHCNLATRPVVAFPASRWRFDVPRDRDLVGRGFVLQCACINACFDGSGALEIRFLGEQ